MRILSWNIERPKINDSRKVEIINLINSFDADLIFLTETNSDIKFDDYYSLKTTEQSPEYKTVEYKLGENKSSVFSKYDFIEDIKTYDNFSSVSGRLETEFGSLYLYSSIIGFLGGKDEFFKFDFACQKDDIRRLCAKGNVCFSGDLNISFSGFPYPSKKVIDEMKEFCETNELNITTEKNNDCAIHIILSKSFIKNRKVETKMIEIPRNLSDHNIVVTEISE